MKMKSIGLLCLAYAVGIFVLVEVWANLVALYDYTKKAHGVQHLAEVWKREPDAVLLTITGILAITSVVIWGEVVVSRKVFRQKKSYA